MTVTAEVLSADYLVIGAGAMAMAFVDVILANDQHAQVIMVDRRSRPGGHWVDAYDFVKLHQPAAAYGVNSQRLESNRFELSSKAEILSYFDRLMSHWKNGGRVRFLSECEYCADGQVRSIHDKSLAYSIQARRRIVNAGYMDVQVPATHPPRYEVDEAITLVPPNALLESFDKWQHFCVIGGGKTAIDAVLYLLDQGISEDRIQWIVPNDMWLWNRDRVQVGRLVAAELLTQLRAIAVQDTAQKVFERLEQGGSVFRLDPTITPKKWRCATTSPTELAQLRTISNVIRRGRIQRITASEIQLDDGAVKTTLSTLHIDCTADGLSARPVRKIYTPNQLTLQSVFMCQQVFSAGILAKLELLPMSDTEKNAIMQVVPHPERIEDMPRMMVRTMDNLFNGHRHIPFWLLRSRMNVVAHMSVARYLLFSLRAFLLRKRPLFEKLRS